MKYTADDKHRGPGTNGPRGASAYKFHGYSHVPVCAKIHSLRTDKNTQKNWNPWKWCWIKTQRCLRIWDLTLYIHLVTKNCDLGRDDVQFLNFPTLQETLHSPVSVVTLRCKPDHPTLPGTLLLPQTLEPGVRASVCPSSPPQGAQDVVRGCLGVSTIHSEDLWGPEYFRTALSIICLFRLNSYLHWWCKEGCSWLWGGPRQYCIHLLHTPGGKYMPAALRCVLDEAVNINFHKS